MANREEAPSWDPADLGLRFNYPTFVFRTWVYFVPLALMVAAAAALLLLAGGKRVEFGAGWWRFTDWPLWAVIALAIAVGAAAAVAAISVLRKIHGRFDPGTTTPPAPPPDRSPQRRWLLALLVILSMLLLLGWGVYAQRLDPLSAALIMVFGAVSVVAGLASVESLERGESPSFESHWGGLGGGTGGWRISPNFTLILLSLIFLAGAFAAARLPSREEEGGGSNPPGSGTGTKPTAAAPAPRGGAVAPRGAEPAAPPPPSNATNTAGP